MTFSQAISRACAIVALGLALGACTGEDEEEAAAAGTNSPPTISGTPVTSVSQGQAYSFAPRAADADGDSLLFGIDAKPAWLSFDTATGRLSGTPAAADVGTHRGIVIHVSDGKAQALLPPFDLTVIASAPNRAPVVTGTPATTVVAGTPYAFQPTASDPDGNALTFSIANRPSWATFATSTGRLAGTPTSANVGVYNNIVISVSDGQASAQLAPFSITVSAPPNRAPTISGTPPTAVMQGTAYAFTPTATDADGDTLTFSIVNAPAWAAFDPATGRLAGTPGAGDVGTTSGIVISASDGSLSAALAAFSVTVQAVATGAATLSWLPPTTNTDGTPLTNLAGYKIYWGTQQGNYPSSATLNDPGLTSYVVQNLVPGTYFFVATAVNAAGSESAFSNVASKTIQ
jgi:hypothetical protein